MKKRLFYLFVLGMAVVFVGIVYLFVQITLKDQTRSVEKKETMLTFSWMGDNLFSAEVQEGLDQYENEHRGIKFSLNYAYGEGYWDQLYLLAAGHELPDIMVVDYQHMNILESKNQLRNLTSYIESGRISLENMDEQMLEYGKIHGQQVGIPMGIKAPALLYNEAVTEQAGITVSDGMTLSEFKTTCRRIYQSTKYKTLLPENQSLNWLDYLLRGEGKSLFDNDGLGYKNPQDALPFFSLYESAAREGWAFDRNAYGQERSDDIAKSPVTNGNGPSNMTWCGFYQSNDMVPGQQEAKTGVTLGITTWPSNHYKKSLFSMPSGFYTIATYTEKGQECAEVINAFSHQKIYLDKLLNGKGLSLEKTYARSQIEEKDEASGKEMNYIKQVVLPESQVIRDVYPQKSEKVNKLLIRLENEILAGENTAQNAAETFYLEADELMK